MKHILPPSGWNPDTGVWEEHEAPTIPEFVATDISVSNGNVGVNLSQDVEPILERCKELARTETYRSPSNEMHHVAEFPMVLVEKYLADRKVTYNEFLTNPEHVKAMMRDPALSHFLIAANATHRVYR